RVTVTGLSYPAISPTNLKCHLDKSFKLILEYRSFQISPQLPKEKQTNFDHHVEVMVAGAAPPVAIIEGMRNMGINVNHVYGL
ncbi:hypothetical protein, partial [Acinetobacter oleivorans]|uniref:hypothetical protein n=1 Tax=Acinetobacter oleivorans TaxID=1148157 RepID=UPI00124E5E19